MNTSPLHRIAVVIAGVALTTIVSDCSREKAATPPDVQSRFHTLLDTLNIDSPVASAEYLEEFLEENKRYQIADSVEFELSLLRAMTKGRYHEARELARAGEFERAEHILKDLSRAKTPDGESARSHLKFEFYIEKAKWFLVRQRFEESKAVADWLLTQDLNRFQTDEVEQILDYTGHVDAAAGMMASQNGKNACRQLIVLLANIYVNDGFYPSSLSLSDLDRLDPYSGKSIGRALASIESYQGSQDHYSLVAVTKTGERIRIVDGVIDD